KPTSKPLSEVLAAFAALPANATSEQLQSFVNSTFLLEGQELVPAELTDFVANPQFLTNISDKFLLGWASEVHGYWPNLTRKVDETFLCEGCVTSLLSLNRSFVVPGGRFREIYYWDSFFVIEGLLLSELYETSKNMILNFLDFVDKYGFVPNGARIYYLNRSQPPFLVQMVKSYFLRTHDTDLLTRALPTLDAEYAFWQRNTTVDVFDPSTGHSYRLNRYNVDNASPRPESYVEDYATATNGTNLNATAQAELYADLATGAETGWDYSSRWISEEVVASAGQDDQRLLRGLRTRQIVPVDLNSILYANEVAMAEFHAVEGSGGDLGRSQWYKRQAKERVEAMGEVLWDEKAGGFFDWDMGKGGRRTAFTVSNYFPFWADAIPEKIASNPEKLTNTFADIDRLLQEYPGLIPTTVVNTGLQWDLPNGWPPLQYILVKALTHTGRLLEGLAPAQSNSTTFVTLAQHLLSTAHEVAQRFVSSAFCAWVQTGGENLVFSS
ncbi:trehalase, partial [Jimgerdemannia flammicorona]